MKTLLYSALTLCLLLTSCNDSDSSGNKTRYLPESVGRINSLQVVISNDLWQGEVGEKIREHFAALTDGLPQQEPIFSISQMNIEAHDGFARYSRTFLYVNMGSEDTVKLKKNVYAKPQIGAFVTGTSEAQIMALIDQNQERIISAFKAAEIVEKQRRTRISLLKVDSLEERFGVSLELPSAYRVASASNDFYWLRKDLKDGTTNVLIYEVPLNTIGTDSLIMSDIIKMRDSIGSSYLPVEEDGLFITEEAYPPYLFASQINDKFAYETKGTWTVKDDWMAGPFINYAVKDEENDRYLILEGFTYAPSMDKRDLQFELEAILKSAKIQ
ncbi:MAG: DUF4837 family protein [Bacteroidota bacterium]